MKTDRFQNNILVFTNTPTPGWIVEGLEKKVCLDIHICEEEREKASVTLSFLSILRLLIETVDL